MELFLIIVVTALVFAFVLRAFFKAKNEMNNGMTHRYRSTSSTIRHRNDSSWYGGGVFGGDSGGSDSGSSGGSSSCD